VELIESDVGWSPYLSMEDAYKLDDVREALRRGDAKSASKSARIYTLVPIAV
jgi:predicted DNA-binding protein